MCKYEKQQRPLNLVSASCREKQEAVARFATLIKITLEQFIINLSHSRTVELENAWRQWQSKVTVHLRRA
jgi:hypothetical protein